ncbi:hypothetical protein [uncultured Chloroflexus sp.]|uniref:hypothetical protein n=1 Tax=uncultured Chloroflexus sp. TaxID=214040 RepID=UPI00263390D5|nr:hypothetical protein [uncultured Chloroflexus sp.]
MEPFKKPTQTAAPTVRETKVIGQPELLEPALSAPHHTRWRMMIYRVGYALTGLLAFVLALELLKRGAAGYGRILIAWLDISSTANALGFGWLLAYIFLSGSPVAAVAVAFFASGTIDGLQTFTMITGSRLGASFIVLFVGFLYHLRGHRRAASVSIGVLALLTTAAIYLPALALGYWLLSSQLVGVISASATSPLSSVIDLVVDPLVAILASILPEWTLLIVGALGLLGAFSLLDRAIPDIPGGQSVFGKAGQLLYRPWAMFLLGAAITSFTLSVSVSLSMLVPLTVRGIIRRENALPYIMGANITTFIDTLVAALIVGGAAAFTIVLVEMLCVAFFSLLALLFFYRLFAHALLGLQEFIVSSTPRLIGFLGLMLIVPIWLLFVRW